MGARAMVGLLTVAAAATLASAQPPADDIVRLSPAERAAALEAGAAHDPAEPPINGLPRGIHGEVGAAIGSGGEHAEYGAVRVPLGEDGAADLSFLSDRSPRPRR